MAFPGDRLWKLRRTVPATIVLGTPSHDCWLHITHENLPDAMITLGGEQAMQQYGIDLAASSDYEGSTRIPLYVVRADLDATPANSRVEIWIRRQDVSDTLDTDVYLWWGSETETTPAVDADYGRNDVFNGSTGTGSPLSVWGAWMMDEDPSNPAPCYTDVSGNDHHANDNGTVTRIDMLPGRGQSHDWDGSYIGVYGTHTWAPGTGNFAIAMVAAFGAGSFRANIFGELSLDTSTASIWYDPYGSSVSATSVTETPYMLMATRDGDNCTMTVDSTENTATGWAAANATSSSIQLTADYFQNRLSFAACINDAPNQYWRRLFSDSMSESTFWDESGTIEAAAITAYILFDDLRTNSEVRIYEMPHTQIWTANFTGITAASLMGDYITFQIQREAAAETYHVWFNDGYDGYSDPITDGYNHGIEVNIYTGYTTTQIAAAMADAVDGYNSDISSSSAVAICTVTNIRNGALEDPTDGSTLATLTVSQMGGTSTAQIDGIENSTGTSWTATYQVVRPRKAIIHIMHLLYQNKRYSTLLTTSGLVVPAGALQVLDRQYYNPPGP